MAIQDETRDALLEQIKISAGEVKQVQTPLRPEHLRRLSEAYRNTVGGDPVDHD